MRKYLIGLFLFVSCIALVGCGSEKKEEKEDSKIVGGWEILLTDGQYNMSEDELNIFNKAVQKYTDSKLEPVVLLGRQVVAGTNYMYLVKDSTKYKVAIVYNDLENNATITNVKDFDITNYAGKEIPKKYEEATGAWEVNSTGKALVLDDDKIGSMFDKATSKIDSMNFNPICVLGKQLVSGTNYAILTYGKGNNSDESVSIYVATLYVDLNENAEISYLAYINLADFNK